jgi:hypothetical protein
MRHGERSIVGEHVHAIVNKPVDEMAQAVDFIVAFISQTDDSSDAQRAGQ